MDAEEEKLLALGIPRETWIYIAANRNYEKDGSDKRLGGFSCNRRWWGDQKTSYSHLFYTVVDGRDEDNVLRYVRDYPVVVNERWVEKEDSIRCLVLESTAKHREKICMCFGH